MHSEDLETMERGSAKFEIVLRHPNGRYGIVVHDIPGFFAEYDTSEGRAAMSRLMESMLDELVGDPTLAVAQKVRKPV